MLHSASFSDICISELGENRKVNASMLWKMLITFLNGFSLKLQLAKTLSHSLYYSIYISTSYSALFSREYGILSLSLPSLASSFSSFFSSTLPERAISWPLFSKASHWRFFPSYVFPSYVVSAFKWRRWGSLGVFSSLLLEISSIFNLNIFYYLLGLPRIWVITIL